MHGQQNLIIMCRDETTIYVIIYVLMGTCILASMFIRTSCGWFVHYVYIMLVGKKEPSLILVNKYLTQQLLA